MFELTSTSINQKRLIETLQTEVAGAIVVFEGWVRNHNEGKQVSSLEYQVYEELAVSEGNRIIQEAKERFNIHNIYCSHRYGHLMLGETAVWVGAVSSHRDDAFRATRYVIDEIKHRLPIWKKEHYIEENPTWVFCKDHHTHVHFDESQYYKKQSNIINQLKINQSRVLVVGAGGLGCPVLNSLASAGVGNLHIADFDKISISNIHRQYLYSPDLVGEKKSYCSEKKIKIFKPIHRYN